MIIYVGIFQETSHIKLLLHDICVGSRCSVNGRRLLGVGAGGSAACLGHRGRFLNLLFRRQLFQIRELKRFIFIICNGHLEHICTHAGNLVIDGAGGPADQRDKHNQCQHSDDNPQHGEKGTHLVGRNSLPCHFYGLPDHAFTFSRPENATAFFRFSSGFPASTTLPSRIWMLRLACLATDSSWVMSTMVFPCA